MRRPSRSLSPQWPLPPFPAFLENRRRRTQLGEVATPLRQQCSAALAGLLPFGGPVADGPLEDAVQRGAPGGGSLGSQAGEEGRDIHAGRHAGPGRAQRGIAKDGVQVCQDCMP